MPIYKVETVAYVTKEIKKTFTIKAVDENEAEDFAYSKASSATPDNCEVEVLKVTKQRRMQYLK